MSKFNVGRSRTRILGIIIIVLVGFLIPIELMSYGIALYLSKRGLAYNSAPPSNEEFDKYLKIRDPELGWPSPQKFGDKDLDSIGSRLDTNHPDPSVPACVSAYGDSFTYSYEVSNKDSWTSVISKKLGCRVNNFGVGGYGTDQAVMRLYKNKFDRPDVLILGHASVDILRNVNQFRALLTGSRFGFKPRFILDNSINKLKRIDLPEVSSTDFSKVYANPEDFLMHEFHLPGTSPNIPKIGFPYFPDVVNAFRSRKFSTFFDRSQVYFDEFYRRDHPSRALNITEEILAAFVEEARSRKSRPLIVLIPIAEDMLKYEVSGEWSYQNLITFMDRNKINYINLGDNLSLYLSSTGQEICDLYRREWYAKGGCTGHFRVDGYRVFGEAVHEKLKELL